MKVLHVCSIFSLLVAVPAVLGFAKPMPRDTYIPQMMTGTLLPVSPGDTTEMMVSLSATPATDQVVYISTATPAKFSSVPSSVTVAAGTRTKRFNVTIASNATSGTASVTASCNGGNVTGYLTVD